MSLEALSREFYSQVIGPGILREVRRACSSQARRYPPQVYARESAWSEEALEDLAQDVITQRLLGERQLEYLFDVASDIEKWRGLLVRQVRISLARRRVRTVVDNLLDRARRIARDSDEFETVATLGRDVLRARGTDLDYRPLTGGEVRAVAEQARLVPRQLPGRSDRAPVVFPARNLEVLLGIVVRGAPGGVTVRDLGRILETVLTDWVPAVLEKDDGWPHRPSAELTPEQLMEVKLIARRVVSDLSKEESEILRARLVGLPDVDAAKRLGISRPTLGKRRNALYDRIRACTGGFDEQEQERFLDEVALGIAERNEPDE
jgi:hypothetical protein